MGQSLLGARASRINKSDDSMVDEERKLPNYHQKPGLVESPPQIDSSKGVKVDKLPQKKVYDFRKNTNNYQYLLNENKKGEEVPSSLIDMATIGVVDPALYEFEKRCDSIISESDLPRLEKEIKHNMKKEQQRRRNLEEGLDENGNSPVRAGDAQ